MKKIRLLSEKPLTERDFSYIIIKLSCFLRQQVFYNIKGLSRLPRKTDAKWIFSDVFCSFQRRWEELFVSTFIGR